MNQPDRHSFPSSTDSCFNNDAAKFNSVDARVRCVSQHFVKYVYQAKTHTRSENEVRECRGGETNIIWHVCGTFGSDSAISESGSEGEEVWERRAERERDRVNPVRAIVLPCGKVTKERVHQREDREREERWIGREKVARDALKEDFIWLQVSGYYCCCINNVSALY